MAYNPHEYAQVACPLSHKSYAGDFKEVLLKVKNEEEANIFLNLHSPTYLDGLVSQSPILFVYLRQNNRNGGRNDLGRAIRSYLKTYWAQQTPPAPIKETPDEAA